jgi:4-hydroxy-tetrahydrodipicolinate synthase
MFKGYFTALITPFRDGAVDEEAYRALIEWQIDEGARGLVPCGTTGESPTLSHDEHMRITEICIEVAAGRVPVIAGTGSNSTEEAISLTRHAKMAGADGALLVMPYYNKPTQAGMYAHFEAVNDAVEIPIIIYNIPGRSVVNMSVETMAKLAALPNIVGVKDATADLARPTQTRIAMGEEFCQLSGEDGTALAFLAQGGHGCISVTADAAARCVVRGKQPWSGEIRGEPARQVHGRDAPAPGEALVGELRSNRHGAARHRPDFLGPVGGSAGLLAMAQHEPSAKKIIAQNRKARRDYHLEDRFEVGIALQGTEVKSLREGRASLGDSYAIERGGEIYLLNAHIAEYKAGGHFNHEPRRPRKLLLRKREIRRLIGTLRRGGVTLVPLTLYFNERGRVKVELAVASGKRKYDKRAAEKEREWRRQKERLLKSRA